MLEPSERLAPASSSPILLGATRSYQIKYSSGYMWLRRLKRFHFLKRSLLIKYYSTEKYYSTDLLKNIERRNKKNPACPSLR